LLRFLGLLKNSLHRVRHHIVFRADKIVNGLVVVGHKWFFSGLLLLRHPQLVLALPLHGLKILDRFAFLLLLQEVVLRVFQGLHRSPEVFIAPGLPLGPRLPALDVLHNLAGGG